MVNRAISFLIFSYFVFFLCNYSSAALFKDGEIIVKFKDNVTAEKKQRFQHRHNIEKIRSYKHLPRHQHLRLPLGVKVKEFIQQLKNDPDVEYAEPNYIRRPLAVLPNDTFWSKQEWWIQKIQANEAWHKSTGSDDIIIAVLDTGVNYLHPDLVDNIYVNPNEIDNNGEDDDGNGFVDDVRGWNFCSPNDAIIRGYYASNDPMDKSGHGTHIAGIIGAVGNNNKGIAGVNWRVKILPVRFLDGCGEVAIEIKAIDYAIERGAKIINASYGDDEYSQAEYDAIAKAAQSGILFVTAAGNSGVNNDTDSGRIYPASYNLPNIIAVANTDKNDNLYSLSNFGQYSVHLAAPGVNVYSTKVGSMVVTDNTTYHATKMLYASDTFDMRKEIVDCGIGLQASDFPTHVKDNIALIQRGTNTFAQKVELAMQAGASAVIIYNNVDGTFEGTLGSDRTPLWVPTVSISKADGEALKALAGTTVRLISNGYSYGEQTGTSMATPMVSAAAALYWSLRPEATYQEVKNAILSSVDNISELSTKTISGGRLNVNRLLAQLDSRVYLSQSMSFNTGWNFKTIHLMPDNTSVRSVISDIVDNIKIIWTYDNNTWQRHRPQYNTSESLQSIKYAKGYWIYSNADQSLNISGWVEKQQLIFLTETWNLVGWTKDDIHITDFIKKIIGDWEVIWNWHAGQWSVKANDPAFQQILNLPEITTVYKGRAYWIKKRVQ